MNNSDYIAIIAIIMSAIISVASTIFTYLMNKVNIHAKRSEIAFEKRLQAFQEIVEHIGKIKKYIYEAEETKLDELKNNVKEAIDEYYVVYRRHLVFLPPTIADNVDRYGDRVYTLVRKNYSYENLNNARRETKKIEREIIQDMQKFIGYI